MATAWRVALIQDITENDSDKTFTVPAGAEWEVLWIYVQYTSTATAGVRQLEIQIIDNGNIIAQWQTGVTQSEGLGYNYLFGGGIPDSLTTRDTNYITTPLMGAQFLGAGQTIRIWDNNAIDASADDMIVRMEYGYHEI
jgi:hypothetical protein